MSAGGLYIWLMLGCFGAAAAIIGVFAIALWIGHVLEKRRTGSTAGFLEYRPPDGGASQEKRQG